MTVPEKHADVLFFCGILSNSNSGFQLAQMKLGKMFGEIVLSTKPYQHEYTKYYNKQMGDVVFRQFLAFLPLKQPTELRDLKLKTNDLEQELAAKLCSDFTRPVNLDPGYVDEPRIVLASCKDFNHRIALGSGVYADLHLVYSKKLGYQGLAWSYPDYTDDVARQFFLESRQILRQNRNNL